MEVDEEVCLLWLLLKKKKRKRRYWVHPILRDRLVHGQFVTLYPKLRMYDNKFFDYLRMSIKSFDELIELIRQDISCSETHLRPSVSPEEKLVITLR